MNSNNHNNHVDITLATAPKENLLIIGIFYIFVLYQEQNTFRYRKLKTIKEKYYGKKIIMILHTLFFLVFYPVYFTLTLLDKRGYQNVSDYFFGMWEMLMYIIFFPVYLIANLATAIQTMVEKNNKGK